MPGADAEPDGGGAGDGVDVDADVDVDVGQQVAVLVVRADAALAGQREPVLAGLPGRGDSVASRECLVDRMSQGERTDAGGRLVAGQGLLCPDGGQVQKVARLRRRHGAGCPALCRLAADPGPVVQVERQVLRGCSRTIRLIVAPPGDAPDDALAHPPPEERAAPDRPGHRRPD